MSLQSLFFSHTNQLHTDKRHNSFGVILLALQACLVFCLLPNAAYAVIDASVGRSDVAAYTGSFKTAVPIAVAPGRAGLQPSLSLQYTSGAGNGLYGMGCMAWAGS